MYITAAHILPIDSPALSPGFIQVEKGIIQSLGPLSDLPKTTDRLDLKDMILLPGFVNAHCHLEYSSLHPLSSRDSFTDWIKEIVHHKTKLSDSDKIKALEIGIKQMLACGVTTIGDHISFDTPVEPLLKSPLTGRLFGEALGILPEVCEDIYQALLQTQRQINQPNSNFQMHVSPHSVHAVHPEVIAKIMNQQPAPLSIHLAESQAEEDYFKKQGGELTELIRSRGIEPPHKASSGLAYLKEQKFPLDKLMLVHGNYLDEEDLQTIAQHHISIVHCPGSHQYFSHQSFPLSSYLKRSINIALGTDSLASNNELNFLNEIRLVKTKYPDVSDDTILKMATLSGAIALKMDDHIGSLTPGKKATIIGFRHTPKTTFLESILTSKQVAWMMINGQISPFSSKT